MDQTKERIDYILNYGMGFDLSTMHLIVNKDGKRCCVLKIPENVKDCYFAEEMKRSFGVNLYDFLEEGRKAIRDEPEKFAIKCSELNCEKVCEKFKDYQKRLAPIEMKKTGENSYIKA